MPADARSWPGRSTLAWTAVVAAATGMPCSAEPAAALAPERVRALVDDFRKARDVESRTAIAAELVAAGPDAAARLLPIARAESGRLAKTYAAAFQRRAADLLTARPGGGAVAAEIGELRRTILDVAASAALTEEMIVSRSDPAVERLGALLAVSPAAVTEARPELAADRSALLALVEIVARCGATLRDGDRAPPAPVLEPGRFATNLAATEELACLLAGPLGPADRRTLVANASLDGSLDPEEVRGMLRLNAIRILVGLPAQAVDLKLVAACRGHSRDMAERGFFAHESPVAGRETPWKRAEAAGTSAAAENIFSGAGEGAAAIEGWWHSPGHHRNMLGPHHRTGLGRWGQLWTQLFG